MQTLDELIEQSTDPRETKRAISVKMGKQGLAPQTIAEVLCVSPQYVSKWKKIYAEQGVTGLRLGYQGKAPYLPPRQRDEVIAWIESHETITLEAVRAYVAQQYDVVYRSKQSYYDLLAEGGMSYHQTTITNPKYDADQVLEKREEIKKNWHNIRQRSNGEN